ncbi:hypothetical protein [Olsenella sp. HMSC062G07]|uniref:hypothetical protein n=1 Tax=Olsenella sp. HMSC062G07 TaxID=1739330 RepID=UPI0011D150A6|nr:hypothetical protein [Olsenella sp. HMSC062G07]
MGNEPLAKSVRLSTILGGDNRLEASTYLREGYGYVRLANQSPHHVRLGDLADIWQPSRLAGYMVEPGKGLPFFTAGQVFEDFPRVRKWLAAPFVPQAESRKVGTGWLLLSCSGVVGRVTAVYPHHLNKIITHDLLRVVPKDEAEYGWLYAYMRTDFFKQIAAAAQYGHMIKHIEVEHANEFPVIMPDNQTRTSIAQIAEQAISLRTEAWRLRDKAFDLFESFAGFDDQMTAYAETPTNREVSLSQILARRSRLDADSYCGAADIADRFLGSLHCQRLESLIKKVYLPPRVPRTYGEGGIPFASPSELFDVNAKPTKHIYAKLIPNYQQFMLKPGEMLMVRSGQKYGLIGRTMLLTENHRGIFGSDDPIRIVPDEQKIRTGYLLTILNDPAIGRPSVVRNAYGTSVPHLDIGDIRSLQVPRLDKEKENLIAEAMDQSVNKSAEADRMENEATRLAQAQIDSELAHL